DCLQVHSLLGRFCQSSGTVSVSYEILYTGYIRDFPSQKLCCQPCAENFAVCGGMTLCLMEFTKRVFVIRWVSSPSVSRCFPLIRVRVYGVAFCASNIFALVMDIFVVTSRLLSCL